MTMNNNFPLNGYCKICRTKVNSYLDMMDNHRDCISYMIDEEIVKLPKEFYKK
jgi:hypothetical protein